MGDRGPNGSDRSNGELAGIQKVEDDYLKYGEEGRAVTGLNLILDGPDYDTSSPAASWGSEEPQSIPQGYRGLVHCARPRQQGRISCLRAAVSCVAVDVLLYDTSEATATKTTTLTHIARLGKSHRVPQLPFYTT